MLRHGISPINTHFDYAFLYCLCFGRAYNVSTPVECYSNSFRHRLQAKRRFSARSTQQLYALFLLNSHSAVVLPIITLYKPYVQVILYI